MKQLMKRAGAGVPSANRITLLRDADGDGVAETRIAVPRRPEVAVRHGAGRRRRCTSPTPTRSCAFRTRRARRASRQPGSKVVDLPGGPLNHHWTKNIIASRDGSKLYATVGSNSNVAENGMDKEEGRAAIWEIDLQQRQQAAVRHRPAQPQRHGLGARAPARCGPWSTSATRLGSDLVPDYLTAVRDGAFYGWPYSYYGQHVDERVAAAAARPGGQGAGARLRARHPRGAARPGHRCKAAALPAPFVDGMFVGEHGSWNRKPRSGYKVVFVPFANGKPHGMPIDVLTGFLSPDGEA